MLSAFYPGAGIDVFPLITHRNIKKWIYTDSQPNSEFGDMIFEGCNRPRFIGRLIKNMNQNHFELKSMNEDIYIFYNAEYEQQVIYETNSVFPRDMQQRHYDCDYIVLCGFDMEDDTIEFINRFQHIITNNITRFESDEIQLLINKDVSTMVYDEDWEYWEDDNNLTPLIKQHIKVINFYLYR